MSRLLLVEDDQTLGSTLKERLEKESHEVIWESNLADAKAALLKNQFDLILLDVGLPDGSGFEFAQDVKKQESIPFIFVTAQNSAESRLEGYELGAEEFIPKPFHLKELIMRVDHVLKNHPSVRVVELDGCAVDFSSREVRYHDNRVELLGEKEMELMKILYDQSPKVVSRDEILNAIWGDKFPSNRTIDNFIVKIRNILTEKDNWRIRSVRGVGYQWLRKKTHE